MEGHLIFVDVYNPTLKIRYLKNGVYSPYHIGESDLLADDWEIVEDIPEAHIQLEYKYFYICKCTATQYVKYGEAFHVCGNCGMKTKLNSDGI